MIKVVLHEKDKEEIQKYIDIINTYAERQASAQEKFDQAKKAYEMVQRTDKLLRSVFSNPEEKLCIRNAELLALYLNNARQADRELANCANTLQVAREGISLLLAKEYNLDITDEWMLDMDRGVVTHGEQ